MKKRILIVGGVAGGASAATRARRLSEDAEIVMFERGEHVSFANCGLPYHIGGVIEDRERLLIATPEFMRKRYNIDVRTRSEVVSIDCQAKELTVRDLADGRQYSERYDKLILSPGAAPIVPPIAGAASKGVFTLRSVADMDAINDWLATTKPERAVVIGGGYIGLEMTEALVARGVAVTIVELAGQVFGPVDAEMANLVHAELERHGVSLRLKTSVTGIVEADGGLKLELSDGSSIECGIAIMAVGVKPEVALAADAGLAIGERGGISVNELMETSDEDIYAVGDAVEVVDYSGGFKTLLPLAGPANRQGCIAADNAVGRASKYGGSQGTAICKVFDLAVGMTGMSEKVLQREGVGYEKVYVHPLSNAGYYPGAGQMTLKLLFDPESGKVLGAQAIGAKGVDKRIDVISVAIRAGMTVDDLKELQLSYAPAYGSAKDAVNYAGYVASNVVHGDVRICHAADAVAKRDDQVLLDVRTADEYAAGTIEGAVNVELDELRGRLGELDRDKEFIVFCQVGLRGYLACRVLEQNGFRCVNLSGGYKMYRVATAKYNGEQPESIAMKNDSGSKKACPMSGQGAVEAVKVIDACGLQCPGPVMRLKVELEKIEDGQALEVLSTDAGFASDVQGWCDSTGNRLVNVQAEDGKFRAKIVKGKGDGAEIADVGAEKKTTIVVFSNDFDKAVATFIIANGAAAMGSEVTLFFTFWGLNILRRAEKVAVKKNFVERMFGMMMPRGAERGRLSQMNMAGLGREMIKGIMRKKNVASLPELIASAKDSGVKLVACAMSMDLMGIKKEELIDGVEDGGVAMYLANAEKANVNLFI